MKQVPVASGVGVGLFETQQRAIKLLLMEMSSTAGYMVSLDLISDFALLKSTLSQNLEELCSSPWPNSAPHI